VKIYALVPILILGRWRPLAVAAIAPLLSAPFLPWREFVDAFPAIVERLRVQSSGGMSATSWWPLIPVAAGALVLAGRDRAAWLVLPVLWPSSQWYYATIAIPAFAIRTPPVALAAALLAVPIPGFPVLAAVAVAAGRVVTEGRHGTVGDQGSRSVG